MTSQTPPPRPLKVLFALHPTLDTLDYTGPLETLCHALPLSSEISTPSPFFQSTTTSLTPVTKSEQGVTITRDISMVDAYATLGDYDILVIPGGGSELCLGGGNAGEPMALIKAFAALPRKEDGGVRTLFSVCTGSLFLAEAGVLGGSGAKATTHPAYYPNLRTIFQQKSAAEGEQTEVLEDARFVVNKVGESGLRVITAGGVSSGIDAALWLVAEVAGRQVREKVEFILQHEFREGIVV